VFHAIVKREKDFFNIPLFVFCRKLQRLHNGIIGKGKKNPSCGWDVKALINGF